MKITILGTGTSVGIPMIACSCPTCSSTDTRDKRLRTSVHIEYKGKNIQIDVGPDFRQQMLTSGIQKLDLVLITHQHSDHTAGIDEIRAFNFAHNGSEIPLFANEFVIKDLKTRFHYIFGANEYPGLPLIQLNEIVENQLIDCKEFQIIPIKIQHGKLNILGYRIQNFAYITDASFISEESFEQLQNLEILIINSLRLKEHHSHFNLEQSLMAISKIGAKKSYITHLSHQMGLHSNVEKILPHGVSLAYDGLVLECNA
ncbi:MAG: MBL fold metallo-hydrolase [Saprospiraceae bacterium]|nr:MBL fold metallo-hydrolase [Saprospiraceae bacterium]